MEVHPPALRLGCITDKWEIASAALWPGASTEPAAIQASPWPNVSMKQLLCRLAQVPQKLWLSDCGGCQGLLFLGACC